MSSNHSNPIDAKLRDVPLPAGLMDRLRQSIAPTDGELDEWLCSVPLPDDLIANLKAVGEDAILDEQLRDVEVPQNMLPRLRVIPTVRKRRWLARVAVAASLMVMLVGGWLAAMGGMFYSLHELTTDQAELPLYIDHGPLRLVAAAEFPTLEIVPSDGDAEARDQLPFDDSQFHLLDAPIVVSAPRPGPAGQLIDAIAQGLPLSLGVFELLYEDDFYGAAHRVDDELPELHRVALPAPRGIEPPAVRGYDRGFLLRHGVHPPAFPALHASLRGATLPLHTATDSFESTRRAVASQRRPEPESIRGEDFLAAMPYGFESPEPGGVALHAVGVRRSAFADEAGQIQIGVKAGDLPRRRFDSTHLTIALDVSTSMSWSDRPDRLRAAMAGLVERMGPNDRLSLVVFDEEIYQMVDSASRNETARMFHLLRELRFDGGTNLAAGLREGLSVSVNESDGRSASLVLITDGGVQMPDRTVEQLERVLSLARAGGLRFRVMDVNDLNEPDDVLARLAAAAGGVMNRLDTADAMKWDLVEALTGVRPVVAGDARLTVRFNPRVVYAWRLSGHEQTTLASLSPPTVESVLRPGQEATALFDIWIRPDAKGKEVARFDVQWHAPGSGAVRRIQKRIDRDQLAANFESAVPSLQLAAIAAETADVLRGGQSFQLFPSARFDAKPKPRSLKHVVKVIDRLSLTVVDRRGVREFVAMVRDLADVRP